MFRKTVIYDHEQALHFRDGRLVAVLGAGAYRFFGSRDLIVRVATGPNWDFVGGQEVTTGDGAPIKVTVAVMCEVVDLEACYRASSRHVSMELPWAALVPLPTSDVAVRAKAEIRLWASGRTLEEAMEQRESLAAHLSPALEEAARAVGLDCREVVLMEFVVAGNVRSAYTELLRAELEGRAALARARNEAATMRSLLNTARLVRENPGLLELRVLTSGQRPRVNFVVGPPPPGETAAPE